MNEEGIAKCPVFFFFFLCAGRGVFVISRQGELNYFFALRLNRLFSPNSHPRLRSHGPSARSGHGRRVGTPRLRCTVARPSYSR